MALPLFIFYFSCCLENENNAWEMVISSTLRKYFIIDASGLDSFKGLTRCVKKHC